jgi:hypothetical protein
MKQHNRDKSILQHMIEHCDKIQKALARFGDDFKTFKNDDVLRDAVSMNLLKAGVISGYDITTEALLTKMMHLLGQYPEETNKVKELLSQSLCGELTIE